MEDLLDILGRLQRRDKTRKNTEQAERISDAWDQCDFRTLWSAARAMLSHPCGPKRRRYDIPLSSLPTAAARATHLRQGGPLVDALGRMWNGERSCGKRDSESNRGYVGPQQKDTPWNQSNLRRIFVVWYGVFDNPLCGVRLRVAAPGELWRQVVDPMRDNTPKKHGVGYKARWLAPFFQSRLWQGIGRVRRTGCVPTRWHRSITFPIDKINNQEGCNAVRLVNAFSPDSKAFFTATS